MKQAQSAEQIIALLEAQPASLALHENLIATQVPALDVEVFNLARNTVAETAKNGGVWFSVGFKPKQHDSFRGGGLVDHF